MALPSDVTFVKHISDLYDSFEKLKLENDKSTVSAKNTLNSITTKITEIFKDNALIQVIQNYTKETRELAGIKKECGEILKNLKAKKAKLTASDIQKIDAVKKKVALIYNSLFKPVTDFATIAIDISTLIVQILDNPTPNSMEIVHLLYKMLSQKNLNFKEAKKIVAVITEGKIHNLLTKLISNGAISGVEKILEKSSPDFLEAQQLVESITDEKKREEILKKIADRQQELKAVQATTKESESAAAQNSADAIAKNAAAAREQDIALCRKIEDILDDATPDFFQADTYALMITDNGIRDRAQSGIQKAQKEQLEIEGLRKLNEANFAQYDQQFYDERVIEEIQAELANDPPDYEIIELLLTLIQIEENQKQAIELIQNRKTFAWYPFSPSKVMSAEAFDKMLTVWIQKKEFSAIVSYFKSLELWEGDLQRKNAVYKLAEAGFYQEASQIIEEIKDMNLRLFLSLEMQVLNLIEEAEKMTEANSNLRSVAIARIKEIVSTAHFADLKLGSHSNIKAFKRITNEADKKAASSAISASQPAAAASASTESPSEELQKQFMAIRLLINNLSQKAKNLHAYDRMNPLKMAFDALNAVVERLSVDTSETARPIQEKIQQVIGQIEEAAKIANNLGDKQEICDQLELIMTLVDTQDVHLGYDDEPDADVRCTNEKLLNWLSEATVNAKNAVALLNKITDSEQRQNLVKRFKGLLSALQQSIEKSKLSGPNPMKPNMDIDESLSEVMPSTL